MQPLTPYSKATACAPIQDKDGQYEVNVPWDWCISSIPLGGYLMSMLCEASTVYMKARGHSHVDLIHVSTNFISKTFIGPAKVYIQVVKFGKDYSTLRVELYQQQLPISKTEISERAAKANEESLGQAPKPLNALCVTALTIHTHRISPRANKSNAIPTLPAIAPPPGVYNDAETYSALHAVAALPQFQAVNQVLYRFPVDPAPSHSLGSGSRFGPSVREQWVIFRGHHRQNFTVESLGVVSDLFEPILSSYAQGELAGVMLGWSPTMSLVLEIKECPPAGSDGWEWLFVRAQAYVIKDGRMDLEVWICDEQGALVAIGRHLALVTKTSDKKGKVQEKEKKVGRITGHVDGRSKL